MTNQTHKLFAGFPFEQKLFGKEARFCHKGPDQEIDMTQSEEIAKALGLNEVPNDAEIQGPSYTLNKAKSQIERDVDTVIKNLEKQANQIITFDASYKKGVSSLDHGGILARNINSFFMDTKIAISKKGEAAQKRMQEISYEETVTFGAQEKLESQRDKSIAHKEKLAKLQKLTNSQRTIRAKLNPFSWKQQLGQKIENYKYEKSEINGVQTNIDRLIKERDELSREKTSLEQGIERDFSKQMESEQTIISFIEGLGIKNEADHILELFAAGVITLQGKELKLKADQKINNQSEVEDALNTINTNLKEMGQTSQNIFKSGLQAFLSRDGKEYIAFKQAKRLETESRDRQAKETQAKANWEKLFNTKLGSTVSLPKIQIGGKKLDAGDYIATERKGKEVVLMRKGAESLKDNFIRFDSEKGTYVFESNPNINDEVKKAAKETIINLHNSFIKETEDLHDTTFGSTDGKIKVKMGTIRKLQKSFDKVIQLSKAFNVRGIITSEKFKKARNQLKDLKDPKQYKTIG